MKRNFITGFILIFGLFTILSGCADNDKKLLFIGDVSMIGDDSIDVTYTFPALIEARMPGFKTIMLERPWTTGTYLEKWNEIERNFPSRADLVFIQLGTEDLIINGHNDSTLTYCIENMTEIIRRMKDHFPNAGIVLLSRTKIDISLMDKSSYNAGFNDRTNEYLSMMGEGYSMLAAESNISFIDLHRLVPIKSTYDGVHLDKNGHSIVSDVLIRFLREYLILEQESKIKH